jgi:hypothetical protein
LFLFSAGIRSFAECEGDFDRDRDVDGSDLAVFAEDFGRTDCAAALPCEGDIHPLGAPDGNVDTSDLMEFVRNFGRADCSLPPAPLNLFNIGNSIGEGEAAYGTIGNPNHDVVWSTGYDATDIVYSLNERFENVDPIGYYENDSTRDATFNQAVSGAVMTDFVTQANAVVAAAADTPSGKVGMAAVLLGNNDVCTQNVDDDMTDPQLFELQYRTGLDVLAASSATQNAFIHVSGIPAIYWM